MSFFVHRQSADVIVPKRPLWKRLLATSAIVISVIIIGSIAWFGYTIYQAQSKIITPNQTGGSVLFHKNISSITSSDLTTEGDGRINILLLGMGGLGHDGAYLTDTIQVLSIDPINHQAAMLSVPRDMWVKIPGYGFSKINAANAVENGGKPNPQLSVETVSQILDLPIQYYVLFDFSGFKNLVDDLGGITVNVDKPLYDTQYPNPSETGYMTIYFPAGIQQMNGTQALEFARSRHSTSDFDRSHRQQLIMEAIKEKATSLGVISNPVKITQIINTIGDHLQTDLQLSDIEQLAVMMKDVNASNITTKVLDTSAGSPLTSADDSRGYVEIPKDGDYTYKSVAEYAHQIFTDPYIAKENATIEVRNASGNSALTDQVSYMLKSYGYNVSKVVDSQTTQTQTQLLDNSSGQDPFTANYLSKRFNVADTPSSKQSDNSNSDFVIIIGSNYGQTN